MVRFFGRNLGGGGSLEKAIPIHAGAKPTPGEEQLLRDLNAEGNDGFPVPNQEAKILDGVHRRTGDERYRVTSIAAVKKP